VYAAPVYTPPLLNAPSSMALAAPAKIAGPSVFAAPPAPRSAGGGAYRFASNGGFNRADLGGVPLSQMQFSDPRAAKGYDGALEPTDSLLLPNGSPLL
jgi:hypothetical protein